MAQSSSSPCIIYNYHERVNATIKPLRLTINVPTWHVCIHAGALRWASQVARFRFFLESLVSSSRF